MPLNMIDYPVFEVKYHQQRTMGEFEELINPDPTKWKLKKEIFNGTRARLRLVKLNKMPVSEEEDREDLEYFTC